MPEYQLLDMGSGPIYAPSVQPLPDGLFESEQAALDFAAGYAALVESHTLADPVGLTMIRVESSSSVVYPIPE